MVETVAMFIAVLLNAWVAATAAKQRDYFWCALSLLLGMYWVLRMALS
jgi:hypothetical protein